MKTIGLIGGMSWESTIEYYRIINEEIGKKLGGLHSAKILMDSYDFAEIARLQKEGDWDKIRSVITDSAQKLVLNGAEVIIIATNTIHKLAPEIQLSLGSIPLYHIADATAIEIKHRKYDTVALLGTKFTMQEDFYKNKLTNEYGINVITPNPNEQDNIHSIIFNELCLGVIKDESRDILNTIIANCAQKGAQAAVLGCTELPNIIKSAIIPLLNTAEIHSRGIVDYILDEEKQLINYSR